MVKYWSPDSEVLVPGCVNFVPELLPEVLRDVFEKNKSYRLYVGTKLCIVGSFEIFVNPIFKNVQFITNDCF